MIGTFKKNKAILKSDPNKLDHTTVIKVVKYLERQKGFKMIHRYFKHNCYEFYLTAPDGYCISQIAESYIEARQTIEKETNLIYSDHSKFKGNQA
jgi:hypothetical protein